MKEDIGVINGTVNEIMERYSAEPLFLGSERRCLPSREAVIELIRELQKVLFPGYFTDDEMTKATAAYYVGQRLTHIYDLLRKQVATAIMYNCRSRIEPECAEKKSMEICDTLFSKLATIQSLLLKDLQAGFDGDPAAKSKEEIVFCYPGFFAIFVYRLAHELYMMNVPFIPRIMTEYAHGKTGIDINSGARIGEYFFIDHGTGVVIGETTEIGNNVKLYQGVTLGALSTRMGQMLSGVKRHPTIGDNVTIYSNASILGGETVIGENCVIGGNTFITQPVPAGTKVTIKNPEMRFNIETGEE